MKYPFLALLAAGPAHGYELRQAFEERFGGLLRRSTPGRSTRRSAGSSGTASSARTTCAAPERPPNKRVYELTADGREALADWVAAPARRPAEGRVLHQARARGPRRRRRPEGADRAAAARVPPVPPRPRPARGRTADGDDPAAELLIEGAALHLQADLQWLDLSTSVFIHRRQPMAILQADGLARAPSLPRHRRARPPRRRRALEPGRVRRGHGAQRLGQVDPPAPARRARPSDRRPRHCSTASGSTTAPRRSSRSCAGGASGSSSSSST